MHRQNHPLLTRTGLAGFMVIAIVISMATAVQSQPPAVELSLRDTSGYPGQSIHLPVYISTSLDTVDAFQFAYTADRPDVVYFNSVTVTDTLILCIDPPACTEFDTTFEIVNRVPLDDSATLTEDWELLSATILGSPTNLRVTGISDLDFDAQPPGVLPMANNAVLVWVELQIECHPDPFVGDAAILEPNLIMTAFSGPQGQTLAPITSTGATITVLDPVRCDLDFSGYPDAIDLSRLIQCLFFNECPACDAVSTDYNCDSQTDAIDLNIMIDYLFFGGEEPASCP